MGRENDAGLSHGHHISIAVRQLPHAEGLPLPVYATQGSAGMDLAAAVEAAITLLPGERATVPTGLCLSIPDGYEGQVRPRSGLAQRYGLAMVNAPGTVDSDYRGEVKVLLINLGDQPVTIRRGDRIAQLVIAPVARAQLVPTEELPPTQRGEGGFGHSGITTERTP